MIKEQTVTSTAVLDWIFQKELQAKSPATTPSISMSILMEFLCEIEFQFNSMQIWIV